MHLKSAIPTTLDNDDLRLLDAIPKATIYAIAKDLAMRISGEEDNGQLMRNEIIGTWQILHSNGIVRQAVPKKYIMRDEEGEALGVVVTPRRATSRRRGTV